MDIQLRFMLVLVVVALFSSLGTSQLPDCRLRSSFVFQLALVHLSVSKPFIITNPTTQKQYSYDLSKAATTVVEGLIGGVETGNTWVIYLNICGNAAIPAGSKCTSPTPVCQVDSTIDYNCGGAGLGNRQVSPYFEPAAPNTFIYDGGVVVLGGGDACVSGTITRTTQLFLKCDQTVATLPVIGTSVILFFTISKRCGSFFNVFF
jgi:hypothetical protein